MVEKQGRKLADNLLVGGVIISMYRSYDISGHARGRRSASEKYNWSGAYTETTGSRADTMVNAG